VTMAGQPTSLQRAISALASATDEQSEAVAEWLDGGMDLLDGREPGAAPRELIEAVRELLQEARTPQRSVMLLMTLAKSVRQQATARAPGVELIWTGPSVLGSELRSTRQVVSEILRESQRYVLVVGYQLRSAMREGDSNVVEEFLDAARRGVRFTFVLNEDEANFAALDLARWPPSNRPRVLTWPQPGDQFASLHAKIVIADDERALITSANLTFHGLRRNIEVGVLVRADIVVQLRRQFVELERERVLIPVV
jgi:hypothetical protein